MSKEKYSSTHRVERCGFKTYIDAKKWADDLICDCLKLSKEPKSVSVLIFGHSGKDDFNYFIGKFSGVTTYDVILKIELETDA